MTEKMKSNMGFIKTSVKWFINEKKMNRDYKRLERLAWWVWPPGAAWLIAEKNYKTMKWVTQQKLY